jgi:hypothetical protein
MHFFTSFPREGESNPVPDGTGKGYISPSGLANRLVYNTGPASPNSRQLDEE